MEFVLDGVEKNKVGKGENAGFQKPIILGLLKLAIEWLKGKKCFFDF